MPTLDQRVAGIMLGAHVLELAAHSPNGWAIHTGDRAYPARRELMDNGVALIACLPAGTESGPDAWLVHDAVPLLYRGGISRASARDGTEIVFRWELLARDPAAAL